ncbi:hypothetical protein BH18THE2_BH18THE2_38370 [soil metagenome]
MIGSVSKVKYIGVIKSFSSFLLLSSYPPQMSDLIVNRYGVSPIR